MDSAGERLPSLTDLVQLFLVEQFPGYHVIVTEKSGTLRYHPTENIVTPGEASVYVDGVHCGWVESGQYWEYDGDQGWEFLAPADPDFFSKLLATVSRGLGRNTSDRWSVSGIPNFLKEAHL